MQKLNLRLEKGKHEFLGALHFKLIKVYNVKNTLRARILIESPVSCREFLLSLGNKKQGVISAVGYGVTITGLDVDAQSATLEIFLK